MCKPLPAIDKKKHQTEQWKRVGQWMDDLLTEIMGAKYRFKKKHLDTSNKTTKYMVNTFCWGSSIFFMWRFLFLFLLFCLHTRTQKKLYWTYYSVIKALSNWQRGECMRVFLDVLHQVSREMLLPEVRVLRGPSKNWPVVLPTAGIVFIERYAHAQIYIYSSICSGQSVHILHAP